MANPATLEQQLWDEMAWALKDLVKADGGDTLDAQDWGAIKGRLVGLCQLAAPLVGIEPWNLFAMLTGMDSASCRDCGGLGIPTPVGWAHVSPAAHHFELISEIPVGSPLLHLLAIAYCDPDLVDSLSAPESAALHNSGIVDRSSSE